MPDLCYKEWTDLPAILRNPKKVKEVPFKISPYDENLQKIIMNYTHDFEPFTYWFWVKGKYMFASNRNNLIHFPINVTEFNGAYCTTKTCNETTLDEKKDEFQKVKDVRFPDIAGLLPDQFMFVHKFDVMTLKTFLEAMINGKFGNNFVKLVFGKENIIALNPVFLLEICQTALKLGYKKLNAGFTDRQHAVIFFPEDVTIKIPKEELVGNHFYIMLMPVFLVDDNFSEIESRDAKQINLDLNTCAGVYFDFAKNKIVSAYTGKQYDVDENVRVRTQGNLDQEDLAFIKKIQTKIEKTVLPILENFIVKDGTLFAGSLEYRYSKSNCGLPDGIYKLIGGAMINQTRIQNSVEFKETDTDTDIVNKYLQDYPLETGPDYIQVNVGTIERNEFLYKLGIASKNIANDELRPVLNTVRMNFIGDDLYIVSTDAYVLNISKINDHDILSEFRIMDKIHDFSVNILNPALIKEAVETYACDNVEIILYFKSNFVINREIPPSYIKVICGDAYFIVRCETGVYPAYMSVIPAKYNTAYELDSKQLKKAIEDIKKVLKDESKYNQYVEFYYTDEALVFSYANIKITEIAYKKSSEEISEPKGQFLMMNPKISIKAFSTAVDIVADGIVKIHCDNEIKNLCLLTGESSEVDFGKKTRIKKAENKPAPAPEPKNENKLSDRIKKIVEEVSNKIGYLIIPDFELIANNDEDSLSANIIMHIIFPTPKQINISDIYYLTIEINLDEYSVYYGEKSIKSKSYTDKDKFIDKIVSILKKEMSDYEDKVFLFQPEYTKEDYKKVIGMALEKGIYRNIVDTDKDERYRPEHLRELYNLIIENDYAVPEWLSKLVVVAEKEVYELILDQFMTETNVKHNSKIYVYKEKHKNVLKSNSQEFKDVFVSSDNDYFLRNPESFKVIVSEAIKDGIYADKLSKSEMTKDRIIEIINSAGIKLPDFLRDRKSKTVEEYKAIILQVTSPEKINDIYRQYESEIENLPSKDKEALDIWVEEAKKQLKGKKSEANKKEVNSGTNKIENWEKIREWVKIGGDFDVKKYSLDDLKLYFKKIAFGLGFSESFINDDVIDRNNLLNHFN
ncbi:MAG: hypothetical protein WCT85_04575, partial [Parachlamydiales bacterium]